jgi:hypothetical protein
LPELRAAVESVEENMFFFEKKNQKTFAIAVHMLAVSAGEKVFCFFFSEKKSFLP